MATPAKRGKGRPTLWTPNAREKYLADARLGLSPNSCAAAAGWSVGVAQIYRSRGLDARQKAEAGETLDATEQTYLDFLINVEASRATLERNHVAVITKAAAVGQWRASAFALSRLFPDRWGDQLAITGAGGGPVQVEHSVREDLLGRLASMHTRLTPGELGEADDVIDVEEA